MPAEDRYRTFWRRFWAGWIDALLFRPLVWLDLWVWSAIESTPLLVGWFLTHSGVMLVYSILLHGLYGQTLGKKLMGIKVYDLSGGNLSMRQAVIRDAVPSALFALTLVDGLRAVAAGRNPYASPAVSFSDFSVLELIIGWGALLWFAAELVTMFQNPQRRAVHDLMARSVVMRVRVPEPVTPTPAQSTVAE